MTNADRAQHAREAIEFNADDNDAYTQVKDHLCNVMHLCVIEGINFPLVSDAACDCFLEELREEEELCRLQTNNE